jgi:flagellar protein FliJ
MKGLPSLIRLHKWELEEERKALARLLSARQSLANQIQRIKGDMARERENADNLQWFFAYPPYADVMNTRLEAMYASLSELDDQVAAAEELVSDAFKELKKFEIALENQLELERQAAERRDQIAMDEIALNSFRRRQTKRAS